jgi:hypothetical protein
MRMISGSQRGPRGLRFHLARHICVHRPSFSSAAQSTSWYGRSFHFISPSDTRAMSDSVIALSG